VFRARGGLFCLALIVSAGCANAVNYADPVGPVRVGRADASPVGTGHLKVVTFNIRFGEQPARAARLLSENPSLRAADILLLQEMDDEGTRLIAGELAMNYVYVPSAVHPRSHRDFGVALLSPWRIDAPRKVPLPGENALLHLRRSAASGIVHTGIGDILVYAVHFETPFGASDATRRMQARALLQDSKGWQGPLLIGGDFNGTDAADELAHAGLSWITRQLHDTAGPFDLDQIVVRGLCVIDRPAVLNTPELRAISDHHPVWTLLQPCAGG
jgi:endonuclease/exonuclease/phosphatase family metal-dependent hydrolase